ncbi:MAG: hypothetical protein EA370_03555, partial [Wenzhouxiangella sp.]
MRNAGLLLGSGLATAAPLIALSGMPNIAHADAIIYVTPGAAGINSGDGCSLVEAIINANANDLVHSECTAGSGADTIVLSGNTYGYDTAFSVNEQSALPIITSEVTIEGNGATIQRNSGSMRILNVDGAGDLTLNRAIITGGDLIDRGGGILNVGVATINDSTISNNNGDFGGGIYNLGATLTVNNSTISGNSGTTGGIDSASGTVTINSSTVTGNTATSGFGGGGVLVYGGSASINTSVISGNAGSPGAEINRFGGSVNADHRNVLGHTGLSSAQAFSGFTPAGTSVIATSDGGTPTALGNVLNTTLADNGGPTPTHALVNGSPAINLVPTSDSACDPGNTRDQRNAPRGSGVNAGGSACDAGAFEFGSIVINRFPIDASVGSGSGTITPPIQFVDQDTDAAFTVSPELGWTVSSVLGDTCTPTNTVGSEWVAGNISQPCSVTATFAEASFEVTAALGTGQGNITPPTQSVIFGEVASFTVTPSTGWSVDTVLGNTCSPALVAGNAWQAPNIQANCAVLANFVINNYTVTAAVDSGAGTITPPSQEVDHGADASFMVIPDTGWSVNSVSGDTCTPLPDAGDQWIAANIVEPCSVTASFAQDSFEVTSEVVAGEGSITPPTQSVLFDGTASLTVVPEPGWSIQSVIGDKGYSCTPEPISGNDWQAPNIQAACAVEASFVINTYTVTAGTGVGDGTITPASQPVDHGSDATFTVTPDTGWSVTSVSGNTCSPVLDSGDQWIA